MLLGYCFSCSFAFSQKSTSRYIKSILYVLDYLKIFVRHRKNVSVEMKEFSQNLDKQKKGFSHRMQKSLSHDRLHQRYFQSPKARVNHFEFIVLDCTFVTGLDGNAIAGLLKLKVVCKEH